MLNNFWDSEVNQCIHFCFEDIEKIPARLLGGGRRNWMSVVRTALKHVATQWANLSENIPRLMFKFQSETCMAVEFWSKAVDEFLMAHPHFHTVIFIGVEFDYESLWSDMFLSKARWPGTITQL